MFYYNPLRPNNNLNQFQDITKMDQRNQLQSKMENLKSMEQQIKQLSDKIASMDAQKNLSKDVIDEEGFPRADLNFGDLAEYKNLKRRFNQLNNDHNKLMKDIQKNLFSLHAQFKNDPNVQQQATLYSEAKTQQKSSQKQMVEEKQPIQKNQQQQNHKIQYLTPFAKISAVEEESPAQKAGIMAGDLISQIGSISIYQPDNIKSIPKVVREGEALKIVVMRTAPQQPISKVFNVRGQQRIRVDLVLVPKKWDGRGLLGCKIDPIYA